MMTYFRNILGPKEQNLSRHSQCKCLPLCARFWFVTIDSPYCTINFLPCILESVAGILLSEVDIKSSNMCRKTFSVILYLTFYTDNDNLHRIWVHRVLISLCSVRRPIKSYTWNFIIFSTILSFIPFPLSPISNFHPFLQSPFL